jgi:hypothetical protein
MQLARAANPFEGPEFPYLAGKVTNPYGQVVRLELSLAPMASLQADVAIRVTSSHRPGEDYDVSDQEFYRHCWFRLGGLLTTEISRLASAARYDFLTAQRCAMQRERGE